MIETTATTLAPEADDPDLARIRAVAAGDDRAFEALVDLHQRRVLRLCERLLGDPEEARDAAQEVFLKVYRKAGSFRPRGRVSTWIHRVAVNHCLNQLRRRKIVRMLPLVGGDDREGEPIAFDPPDEAPGPEDRLAARRRWAATRRAIDALPLNQRAVLVLARFEGMGNIEIAATLGITVGAVESRLIRALRNLDRAQETPGPRVP